MEDKDELFWIGEMTMFEQLALRSKNTTYLT